MLMFSFDCFARPIDLTRLFCTSVYLINFTQPPHIVPHCETNRSNANLKATYFMVTFWFIVFEWKWLSEIFMIQLYWKLQSCIKWLRTFLNDVLINNQPEIFFCSIPNSSVIFWINFQQFEKKWYILLKTINKIFYLKILHFSSVSILILKNKKDTEEINLKSFSWRAQTICGCHDSEFDDSKCYTFFYENGAQTFNYDN